MESDVKRIPHEKSVVGSNDEAEVHTTSVSKNIKLMLDSREGFQELKRDDLFEGEKISLDEFPFSPNGTAEAYPSLNNKDLRNFILLIVLYLLQGVPVGLAFGSIPFLLKSKLSYSQIGIFSLATYPYSLKLLWSPIVDATYSKKIGRRKSWIIPIQLLTGSVFLWLGKHIDRMLIEETPNVYTLTLLFFTLILFSATQDVAVDGWALTLLSKNSLSYASTAQTIGLNTGYFLSFTVFLTFNSADFSNKYFRNVPNEKGLLELGDYLTFWSLIYFGVSMWLLFAKSEDAPQTDDYMDIKTVYQTIWNICKMPHMRKLIMVLLVSKIGFIANEAVTGLKLLEKGFSKEDLALAVLIDFPVQILVGYYAARWSNGNQPLKPWIYAFYGRLFFAFVGMMVVRNFPGDKEISNGFFFIVITSTVLSSFMSTVQFVSISAFMTIIADPVIGGTYMTLLATFSNFGGTWPRFFVLEAVDYFTVATCHNQDAPFSCVSERDKSLCDDSGGMCVVNRDGYYMTSVVCVTIGALLFLGFILPQIKKLQALPHKMWKVRIK